MSGTGITQSLVVTVHGDAGTVDLAVPPDATAAALATEYAVRHGLPSPPALVTSGGRPLASGRTLDQLGVESGDLLVACPPGPPTTHALAGTGTRAEVTPWPTGAWFWAGTAALLAVLGGLLAAGAGETERTLAAVALGVGALVAVLPLGRCREQRLAVAPALGGAAAYAVVATGPGASPALVVAVVALVAAGAAAVGRALAERDTEVVDVVLVAGLGVFVVTGLSVLADVPATLPWSVLVAAAVVLARFSPGFVVDVPDEQLIDLERLAVTAWSARDRTTGKRSRVVIGESGVRQLLGRAGRLLGAAAAVTLVVVVVAVPVLLAVTESDLDRLGVRLLLFFGGAALLLGARNHRHTGARVLLRLAGLFLLTACAVDLVRTAEAGLLWWLALGSLALGTAVYAAAVATGRGWRSVWWSRRAEVAETFCGACAVAAVVVASGAFRMLWE